MAKEEIKTKAKPNKILALGMMGLSIIGTIIIYWTVSSFTLFLVGVACFIGVTLLYRLHLAQGGMAFKCITGTHSFKQISTKQQQCIDCKEIHLINSFS